jgi:hypothetical protein
MLFGWSIVGKMHYHIRINTEIIHKWKMDLSTIVVAKCRILHGRVFKVYKPHLLFCYGPCIYQKLIHSFYKYVFQNMTWHISLIFNFVAVSLI